MIIVYLFIKIINYLLTTAINYKLLLTVPLIMMKILIMNNAFNDNNIKYLINSHIPAVINK